MSPPPERPPTLPAPLLGFLQRLAAVPRLGRLRELVAEEARAALAAQSAALEILEEGAPWKEERSTAHRLVVALRDADGRAFAVLRVSGKRSGRFDAADEAAAAVLAALAAPSVRGAALAERLRDSYLETVESLALSAESRDRDDAAPHLRRVRAYARAVAEAAGFSDEDADAVEAASPLHDVGKIGVPDAVLKKPGPLDPDEFARMKDHTTIGWSILSAGRSPLLRLAASIALTHHERWDGRGYPRGLRGEQIPLAAQVVAVADVFDALSHGRVYKPAWSFADCRRHIRGEAGKAFSPRAVEAFLDASPVLYRELARAAEGEKRTSL